MTEGCVPVGEVTVGAGPPTVGWVPIGEVTVGAGSPTVGCALVGASVGADTGNCTGVLVGEGATISTATKTEAASVLVSISPSVPSTWLFEGAAGSSSLLTASTLIP